MSFQMKVEDIFNFENGNLVLMGPREAIKGTLEPAAGRQCRLFEDNIMVCDVETVGIRTGGRSAGGGDLFSLEVTTLVSLPSGPTSGEWLLKQI